MDSSKPLVCLYCSHIAQQTIVCQLQSETVVFKAEVGDLCAELEAVQTKTQDCDDAAVALASEVHQLKSAIIGSTILL